MEKQFFDKTSRKQRPYNNKKKADSSKKSSDKSMFPYKHSLMPTELTLNPIIQFTRRYQASGAISAALTIYGLLDTNIFAITTTVGIPLARVIRLKKMRLWSPVATQGTSVTNSIQPFAVDPGNNSYVDLPKKITDSSMDTNRPAFLEYRPDLNHPSGSWHGSVLIDANLVSVICPTNSILDLHLELVQNIGALQGYQKTLVGATPGLQYTSGVCGAFVPQQVNVI